MLHSGSASLGNFSFLDVSGKLFCQKRTNFYFVLRVVYVYAPELYPTTVRSIGMGLASMMARIGGVAAPYIILTAEKGEWIPLVI